LAFLPLRDSYCSIVWSTSHERAQELLGLDEALFREQLAQDFDYSLGEIVSVSPRAAFPLRLQHSLQYVQPRLALLGDAAHAIHPLAGQGVNLGLLDAAVLAEVLLEGAEQGKEVGSLAVLRRYERWRKGDNLSMMFAMDGFKRMFGSQLQPVKALRNLGLGLFNSVAPVKQVMIHRAMGLGGELPRLARAVTSR
jgi:2-octaprenylphenol hydroxylase